MFEKEFETLNKILPELKLENPQGGYVVINKNEVLGVWLDRQDALKQGIERYGNIPFLVRNIFDQDLTLNFTKPLF